MTHDDAQACNLLAIFDLHTTRVNDPVALHAEHGLWSRAPGSAQWKQQGISNGTPFEQLSAIMDRYTESTPGSMVERKTAGVAWHYRMADDALGELQAERLATEMDALADEHGLDVLRGDKVIEVRPTGVHKGLVVSDVLRQAAPGSLILALGDDRTDEDLFSALPPGSIAVHVGPRESVAPVRLPDVATARAFLRDLAIQPTSA